MISKKEFVSMSLEINLFFSRIMKEHSIFVVASLPYKNKNLIDMALSFKNYYESLLVQVMPLANLINPKAIKSGAFVTKFTLEAENITQHYTGIPINTNITSFQLGLVGSNNIMVTNAVEQSVAMINQIAINLTKSLIKFKTRLLSDASSCKIFSHNYPTMIHHIRMEAEKYLNILEKLQRREEFESEMDIVKEEEFWNHIMEEHAKFIRGLLDPSEEKLIVTANDISIEFEKLVQEAQEVINKSDDIEELTNKSIQATKVIKDFKTQGTEGLLECKIKSIILPLLAEHTLREANYYLRLLKIFKNEDAVN